jgi:hypothetical protein
MPNLLQRHPQGRHHSDTFSLYKMSERTIFLVPLPSSPAEPPRLARIRNNSATAMTMITVPLIVGQAMVDWIQMASFPLNRLTQSTAPLKKPKAHS